MLNNSTSSPRNCVDALSRVSSDEPRVSAGVNLLFPMSLWLLGVVLLSTEAVLVLAVLIWFFFCVVEGLRRAGWLLFCAALAGMSSIRGVAPALLTVAAGVAAPFFKSASSSCHTESRKGEKWSAWLF